MNISASSRALRGLLLALMLGCPTPGMAAQAQQPDSAAAQAQREVTQPGNNSPFWKDVQAGRTGSTQIENIEAGHCESYWERECTVEDKLLYRDLARAASPAGSLYQATDGRKRGI